MFDFDVVVPTGTELLALLGLDGRAIRHHPRRTGTRSTPGATPEEVE